MESGKDKMTRQCPKCLSGRVQTERRPKGDSKCLDCGHKGPTKTFDFCVDVSVRPSTTPSMQDAYDLLREIAYDPATFHHTNSVKARDLIEKLESPPSDV